MRSPGRAPERRIAFPFGTEPNTTMSASTPCGDSAVSPPAKLTPNLAANGQAQHGGVIADPSHNAASFGRLAADASDQRFFSEGQSGINIDEKATLPKSAVR